jgi:hypothetical protein
MYSVSPRIMDAGTCVSSAESITRPGHPSIKHGTLREGAILGLVVGTGIWLWIAVVDAISGHSFHAFTVLGGLVLFTAAHFLLNIVYGVVIVSAIHGAARAPSLIIALVFGFVVLEIAFAMVTVLLSNLGLGDLAWLRIFGGSLIGAAIALATLSRRHPLLAQLRRAETEM